ncbi:MAG: DUF1700 domain-containing protein [Ruminococcaceae bacterium]|nr:DUF1700 domain-containing protein [Oscillospiraceae bacterium]
MCKREFINILRERLCGLPEKDVEERIGFYAEMIDDRMEEGLSEEQAVAAMGSAQDIASVILSEIPLTRLVKEKIKPKRRLRTWEIVLLALGCPIWLSLLLAAFAVGLSLYASVWAVAIACWSVFVSFVGGAFGGTVAGAVWLFANAPFGLLVIAAGLVSAGLSVYAFYGCRALTGGIGRLTRELLLGVKRCFLRKGERNA